MQHPSQRAQRVRQSFPRTHAAEPASTQEQIAPETGPEAAGGATAVDGRDEVGTEGERPHTDDGPGYSQQT